MPTKTITQQGLKIERKFTKEGTNPLDEIEYEIRSSKITEPAGKIIFEMDNIEAPKSWSQLAVDIAASKYFKRAQVPGIGKERSIKDMVSRVPLAIRQFGQENNYFESEEDAQAFEDELNYMLINQMGAFNSPVWFNCGLYHKYGIKGKKPGTYFYNLETNQVAECEDSYSHSQSSACFIQKIEDSLESIYQLITNESKIFKFGSGCTSGDSLIFTQKIGLIKIRDLFNKYKTRKINNFDNKGHYINIKDEEIYTLSLNKDGTFSWDLIEKVWDYEVDQKDKLRIKLNNGTRVTVSAWHPFMFWDGSKIIKIRADELEEGDAIIGPNSSLIQHLPQEKITIKWNSSFFNKLEKNKIELDKDLFWLIGYFMGDGNLGNRNKRTRGRYKHLERYTHLRLRFHDETLETLYNVKRILENKFDAKININKDNRGSNGHTLQTMNRKACNFFRELFGKGSKTYTLRMPKFIYKSGIINITAFLAGLLDSDGYITQDGKAVYSSASREFISEIGTLASLIGCGGGVTIDKHTSGATVIRKSSNNEIVRLIANNISNRKRKQLLTKSINRKHRSSRCIPLQKEILSNFIELPEKAGQWLSLEVNQERFHAGRLMYGSIINPQKLIRLIQSSQVKNKLSNFLTNIAEGVSFVTSIEPIKKDVDFYDLTIEKNTNYLAGENALTTISNTGSNFSSLRGAGEKLSGGGVSSGLMSYLKILDRSAAAVKSGGITRRAAKMVVLDMDHPEIEEYITWKVKEEDKVQALINAGYSSDFNGEAYSTVSGQNSNNSVMIPDRFMQAVIEDKEWDTIERTTSKIRKTYKAHELMRMISHAAWRCADPGVMFYDTMNKWHTCKNSERIHATNPCVTGDTRILTADGNWIRIDKLVNKKTKIITNAGLILEREINGSFSTGVKPVYSLKTKSGYELKLTADHKVFTINRGFVKAMNLTKDDLVLLPFEPVSEIKDIDDKEFYQLLGIYLGDGCGSKIRKSIQLTMNEEDKHLLEDISTYIGENFDRMTHKNSPATVQITPTSTKLHITNNKVVEKINQYIDATLKSYEKTLGEKIFESPLSAQRYVLQGLFTADGTVANYGEKSQYVALDSSNLQLLKDVQLLLTGFGIKSKVYTDRRAGKDTALLPDGKGGVREYKIKPQHSLRISKSSRVLFEKFIGFMPNTKKGEKLAKLNNDVITYKDYPFDFVKSIEYLGEKEVYDLTETTTHTFVANGITVHNCGEYIFIDDTACNLSSLNLMKFVDEEGNFNIELYRHTCRIFFIAQEILVDLASYPTKLITQKSHQFRTIGLGHANLGTLLMTEGIPYDSDKGRAIAAAITAITTGHAYKTSAEIASIKGPFEKFEENKEPMTEVMNMHRDSAYRIDVRHCPSYLLDGAREDWDKVIEFGEKYGFRNAQATVLAPTGTIGLLMGCDTTGIEPEFSLIKWKKLAGGGYFKIVNQSIEKSLQKLGYDDLEIKEIIGYLMENGNIENAPYIKKEHLPVFDCANKNSGGSRFIEPMGHVKIMAAVQPFISGGISKTVNLPKDATVEDIEQIYFQAWKLGLKDIALYRDGCKLSQPLNTQLENTQETKTERAIQRKLPYKRKGITVASKINGNKIFIRTGEYEDAKIGEIFIDMHKAGSSYRSLLNCFAIAVSMGLQHGVPLEKYVDMFTFTRFEPSGLTDHPNIRSATSVIDFIFRVLGMEYLGRTDFIHIPPATEQEAPIKSEKQIQQSKEIQTKLPEDNLTSKEKHLSEMLGDAPLCDQCGHTTIRSGSCYKCLNCGNSMGCS